MSEVGGKARGIILTGLTDLPTSREHIDFAGYVLFSRNGASVAELRFFSDMLRAECLGPPPIIAIDQEGGRVVRLHEGIEVIPVSYTHLDVYKRQPVERTRGVRFYPDDEIPLSRKLEDRRDVIGARHLTDFNDRVRRRF